MIAVLVTMLLASGGAHAQPHLDSPADLEKRAEQGRIALREVLLDMEANVVEMRDPETFYSYFRLLDRLQTLSDQFNLDDIYPKAVANLGNYMADHGIRWLDLTKPDGDNAAFFTRWMNIDSVGRVLSIAETRANENLAGPQIRALVENVNVMIPILESRFPDRPDTTNAFRRLSSDLAVKFLTLPGTTDEEARYWIPRIRLPASMQSYVEFLNWQMGSMTKETRDLAHIGLGRLLLVQRTVQAEPAPPPASLTVAIGDSAQNLLMQFVQFEVPFDTGELEAGVALLHVGQLKTLSSLVQNAQRLPSDSYVGQFLHLCNTLVERLNAAGIPKEAEELARWTNSVAAALMAKQNGLEGNYELRDSRGKTWYFTLVQARESLLYAALADGEGFVYKPYFNVSYNVVTGQFTASEREPDLDGSSDYTAKINLHPDGTIEVEDLFARRIEWRRLSGRKIANFPNFFQVKLPTPDLLEGTYEGTVYFPKDQPGDRIASFKGMLVVTPFNGYSLGRLMLVAGAGDVDIDFITGSKGTDGVLYLTTVRNYRTNFFTTWIQFRGRQVPGGIEGHIIVGGRGISRAFVLKKVQERGS